MPPRYAYWTILIDNKPTAFRAREQADLLPTVHQLRRTNSDVVMKWFARGRLWESPEAERAAQRKAKVIDEKRGRDWRPGGKHRDPRDRFKKRAKAAHDRKPPRGGRPKFSTDKKRGDPPWRDRQDSRNQSFAAPPSPEQIVTKPEPPDF